MAIPYVSGALRGWTKKQTVRIITKTIVNHIVTQTARIVVFDLCLQPLQPEKVNRKPEEQRSWKWFDIVTKSSNEALKVDDEISVNGISYRIDSIQPWADAGYRRYEATEEFSGNDPMYAVTYNGNGNTSGIVADAIAYQPGASILAAGVGSLAKTGYTFNGWNTAADGSGTAYAAGATITIGTADILLYAQWVEVST